LLLNLKDHSHEKNLSTKHMDGCFRPQMWVVNLSKNVLIFPQKLRNFERFILLYKNKKFEHCSPLYWRICGASKRIAGQALNARFFKNLRWWAGWKRFFIVVGPVGAEKVRKLGVATASMALRKNMLTPAPTRSGPEFTSRGRRVEASQLFRNNQTIFSGVGGP
jgi:hypothetical protein